MEINLIGPHLKEILDHAAEKCGYLNFEDFSDSKVLTPEEDSMLHRIPMTYAAVQFKIIIENLKAKGMDDAIAVVLDSVK